MQKSCHTQDPPHSRRIEEKVWRRAGEAGQRGPTDVRRGWGDYKSECSHQLPASKGDSGGGGQISYRMPEDQVKQRVGREEQGRNQR
eukprot:scaffold117520_cov80-Cyclotella_meneghiniana.AAC.2